MQVGPLLKTSNSSRALRLQYEIESETHMNVKKFRNNSKDNSWRKPKSFYKGCLVAKPRNRKVKRLSVEIRLRTSVLKW